LVFTVDTTFHSAYEYHPRPTTVTTERCTMRTLSAVVSSLLLLAVIASSPDGSQPVQDDPTHVLELTAGEVPEPARTEAWLDLEGDSGKLTVQMPDGERFTVDCVLTEDDEIKFQLSRIAGDKLVNIQFMGTGSVDEGFEGTFTAMVEAQQRPDMSGTFALVPRK
jgi:hypothetical protein